MNYRYTPILALALFAVPAAAHVTANPSNAIAGTYFQTSFRITHGCEDSDTVAVQIQIPEGVMSVHPQAKPGWSVKISKYKLPEPVDTGHGKMADEAVNAVSWTGGNLPADQYDDFGVVMKLPAAKGRVLWFPVIQQCRSGENRWVEIPAEGQSWHSLERPAPFVKLATGGN
ncbi:MAG: YcnI family protein [Bdellovibrionales bacterium]